MTPPTLREFTAALAALDSDAFARFLADLYAARGRPTEVDGDQVVADGRAVRVHAPPRYLPARLSTAELGAGEGDAVATTDPAAASLLRERGVDVAGPQALRRALLYGVDPATGDELYREHFDRPLRADRTPAVTERARRALAAVDARVAAAALVAASLLAAGLLGVGDIAAPADEPDADVEAAGDGRPAEQRGAGGGSRVAPGVTAAGVSNATALSRAHAAAVGERSYEWTVTYERGDPGVNPVVGDAESLTWTVRVENATAYRTAVEGSADADVDAIPDGDTEVYADGTDRFVRREAANGTATVRRSRIGSTGDVPRFAARAAELVARFLGAAGADAVEPAGRGGDAFYRVDVRGDERRATALVSESGFVARLEARYAAPAGDGATVSFEYRRLDEVTVEPPRWVGERGAAEPSTRRSKSSAPGDRGPRGGRPNSLILRARA